MPTSFVITDEFWMDGSYGFEDEGNFEKTPAQRVGN